MIAFQKLKKKKLNVQSNKSVRNELKLHTNQNETRSNTHTHTHVSDCWATSLAMRDPPEQNNRPGDSPRFGAVLQWQAISCSVPLYSKHNETLFCVFVRLASIITDCDGEKSYFTIDGTRKVSLSRHISLDAAMRGTDEILFITQRQQENDRFSY